MKKFTLILLATLATAAFADPAGPGPGPGQGPGHGHGGHHNNPTIQATMLLNTAVVNSAAGRVGTAEQNLASNVGPIAATDTQMQMVAAENSLIRNSSLGGHAQQNIASNIGYAGLLTSTYQVAFIKDSAVINRASWGGKALQNLSSNSNCVTCSN